MAQELRKLGCDVCFLDLTECSRGGVISYAINSSVKTCARTINNVAISADAISAVWYRRPRAPKIPPAVLDKRDRNFILEEWKVVAKGFLDSIEAPFVNDPVCQELATKPIQLKHARLSELRIPDTLITNDPEEAKAFIEEHEGNVIHKAMTAPRDKFLHTQSWKERDLELLSALPLCPVIFQERILGPADVRATIIGEEIFAARIETALGTAEVDSRLDLGVPYTQTKLPPFVEGATLGLMRRLGLAFGTVDFKVTSDNEYVFLEINPQGQFLYIEILTGLPLTMAMAMFLKKTSRKLKYSKPQRREPSEPRGQAPYQPHSEDCGGIDLNG